MQQSSYQTAESSTLMEQLQHSVRQTMGHAQNISASLKEQDEILDNLHDQINLAAEEGEEQNNSLRSILKDTKKCSFYSVVLVLVVLIVFFLFI